MCGIIGGIGFCLTPEACETLTGTLSHRGPDSAGLWQEGDVWLGHRRLAILDLSPLGHQPMLSADERHVLVFNGEVYNYKALRTELEAAGFAFKGQSDTEVVLCACLHWGVEKASMRFEGMFAFALYDRKEASLWLVRDPLGIKPLYYAQVGQRVAFSSELTPLLSLEGVDTSIDNDALHGYFRYLCVPSPLSIVKGVRKLPSGSLLHIQSGTINLLRYWSLPEKAYEARASRRALSLDDAADALESILRNSVRDHMQSDVPYGAFLSGGIDSSTIVALMQAMSSRPVQTFSIGFDEATHNEADAARSVAQHLGTDHHELILKAKDALDLVPHIISFFDEPFADNSAIPTYLVSRFAREHVTVCLSGDGGDELFGGYPRYFWAQRIERARSILSPYGTRLASSALKAMPDGVWDYMGTLFGSGDAEKAGLASRVHRFANYLATDRAQAYAQTMSCWIEPATIMQQPAFAKVGAEALSYPDLSWAEEMMLIDQQIYLQDDILTKMDRASMAVSLESRVPFLTHSVVEKSWELESSLKLAPHGDRGKLVLRKVLSRYVPDGLVERPKQGFGMPIASWLRGPLKDWADSLLQSADLDACGLMAKPVRDLWVEHGKGADHASHLWTVLMYRLWSQKTGKG